MTLEDLKKLGGKRFLCTVTGEPGFHATRLVEVAPSGQYANLETPDGKLGWVQIRHITYLEELPALVISSGRLTGKETAEDGPRNTPKDAEVAEAEPEGAE